MPKNRGKQFEDVIRNAFERCPETCVIRLPDQMGGFRGGTNICDFIVYCLPHQYFVECKSCHGASLRLDNITRNQREGMTKVSRISGVRAGVLVWYIDHDCTMWIPIHTINRLRSAGCKSLNWQAARKRSECVEISGRKKRVFFDYDFRNFLETGGAGWHMSLIERK